MSVLNNYFTISYDKNINIECVPEESVRALVNALEITPTDKNFGGLVTSTNGTQVKFVFGSDGNYAGVTAKIGSQSIKLFNGVGSSELGVFSGAPVGSNIPAGWEVVPDLTVRFLNQPAGNEPVWEMFYAKRISMLNTWG